MQPKDKTSFAATLLLFGLPAPEETINSKIRQQTTLVAETKFQIDIPLPASTSSRRGINEKDILCLSQWRGSDCLRWGLSGFGMWLLRADGFGGGGNWWLKKNIFFEGDTDRCFGGGEGHRKCGKEGIGSAMNIWMILVERKRVLTSYKGRLNN